MIDTAQVVLIFVIIILTLLLLVLGIQVFFILKDLRKTLHKANRVLDSTQSITDSFSGPLSSITALTKGGTLGFILKLIRTFLKDSDKTKK